MSGKKLMKRIHGVYKEAKKEETERVSIVVAGTQGVDRDLFIEKLCGQKVGIFESVDYKDYTDKVEEALKKLRDADFAILMATKSFTFDFISFLICVLESQVPYVVYIKENETEFKSKIKNIIQTDDFEISRNEQETTEKLFNGLGQKFFILGRECPHLSKKAASNIIKGTSEQNGLLALAFFLQGSKYLPMSSNQLKMILLLEKNFNIEAGFLFKEAAVVFTYGYLLKRFTRRITSLPFLPVFIVNAIIAYGGTKILGGIAYLYFRETEKQKML